MLLMCQDKNGEVATRFSSMLDMVILTMAVQRLMGLGGPSEHFRTLLWDYMRYVCSCPVHRSALNPRASGRLSGRNRGREGQSWSVQVDPKPAALPTPYPSSLPKLLDGKQVPCRAPLSPSSL